MVTTISVRADAITPQLAKEMNQTVFVRSNTFSVRQRTGNITIGLHGLNFLRLPKMNTNAVFCYLEELSENGKGMYWTCSLVFPARSNKGKMTSLVLKNGYYNFNDQFRTGN